MSIAQPRTDFDDYSTLRTTPVTYDDGSSYVFDNRLPGTTSKQRDVIAIPERVIAQNEIAPTQTLVSIPDRPELAGPSGIMERDVPLVIDTYTPALTGFVNDVFPTGGSAGITTVENSPISTTPQAIPNDTFGEINTLLSTFQNGFLNRNYGSAPITAPQEPAVTVIPGQSNNDSGNSNLVIYLAVAGIAVTIMLHWYYGRKKK